MREPFYGVFDPVERAVYVNDPGNLAGTAALLVFGLPVSPIAIGNRAAYPVHGNHSCETGHGTL